MSPEGGDLPLFSGAPQEIIERPFVPECKLQLSSRHIYSLKIGMKSCTFAGRSLTCVLGGPTLPSRLPLLVPSVFSAAPQQWPATAPV
jgi:hypothetical protein